MVVVDHHLFVFDPGLGGLFAAVAGVLEVLIAMRCQKG